MIRSREALFAHLDRGGLVRLEFRHDPEPKRIWSDPMTGQTIHGDAASYALKQGKLKPLGDALFQDTSQTFEGVDL